MTGPVLLTSLNKRNSESAFLALTEPKLSDLTKTRVLYHSGGNSGSGQSFISFYNVPVTRGSSGAESENNRLMFTLTELQGKVKIELRVCNIFDPQRNRLKLRAKTGTPKQIAEYLAQFLNSVTATYEPKLQSY